ncbi:hypothetical protein QYE76_047027 [Lolium multiflorum]|uniref:Uncharacterized protein n=1 Tax=Lolium multiflorum TaxID=4521 RepID=A0AAD8WZR6_LOLMU|nr:hypothetical protein QYE76_047027 [Lolium multiflorum]
MNSGVGHGSWYVGGGGGRAGCGNCGQATACAGGCGEGGHGSQAGAAVDTPLLERVGVAGIVINLPCVSADSRSWIASSSHIASSLSSLLASAMAMASSSLMSSDWVSGSHAGPRHRRRSLRARLLVLVLLVVLLFFHGDLAVEVLEVAEIASAAACVELPRPERDPVVGVERVGRIFSEIGQQDRSVTAHLVPALLDLARQAADRHTPGVDVPTSSRQVCIRPWHRPVFLRKTARELDVDVPPDPWLLTGPSAASLVVVLGLAERPAYLPHGIGRVDRVGSGNGVVGEMGADNVPLRGSDAISPSMSCHYNAAQ